MNTKMSAACLLATYLLVAVWVRTEYVGDGFVHRREPRVLWNAFNRRLTIQTSAGGCCTMYVYCLCLLCRCRPLDGSSVLMFDGVSTTARLPFYIFVISSASAYFHSIIRHVRRTPLTPSSRKWTTHLCVACKLISSFVAFRWRENPLDRYQRWINCKNEHTQSIRTNHTHWHTRLSILVRYHQFGIINGAPNCSRTFNDEQRRRGKRES